ncbi:hypothetical protein V6N13_120678 [Hibiscus sabdariffa]
MVCSIVASFQPLKFILELCDKIGAFKDEGSTQYSEGGWDPALVTLSGVRGFTCYTLQGPCHFYYGQGTQANMGTAEAATRLISTGYLGHY